MNQSKTQYENALANLSNSHYAIAPDAIIKEDSQAILLFCYYHRLGGVCILG